MSTYYRRIDREVQVSEATTVKRSVYYELGTAEVATVTVSKAGGAFGSSDSTNLQVADSLYNLQMVAADLDTEGELAFKLDGSADDTYIYGLCVVDHDPFDAIGQILDDTGTSGVVLADGAITAAKIASDALTNAKIADGAIGPEQQANAHHYIPLEIQQSEATTVRRTGFYQVGTHETQTITVSKAGSAFGASSAAATQLDGTLYKLELTPGDVDTLGELAVKSEGATLTQYITGMQIVEHDPYVDPRLIRQALAGKIITDTSDNTIKIYDTDGVTVLVTLTKSFDGTATTWTPS